MEITFPGQTVIVTGAAHGFGRAFAIAFAAAGAHVWGCDLVSDELEETARLGNAVGRCTVRAIDITQRDSVINLVRAAEESSLKGAIDVLVNNAGGVLGQVGQPIEQVRAAEWHAILDVNLTAVFTFAQAVAPAMKRAGHGRIINIASGAGLGPSLTGIQAYAAAKAGQINLTRQLCHELGPFGITANAIAPGFVRSNANTERQWAAYGPDGQRALVESIAMRRLGSADDIAAGVLFLASAQAGWICGQVLSIDGGH